MDVPPLSRTTRILVASLLVAATWTACRSATIRDGVVDGRLSRDAVLEQLDRGADPNERVDGWSVLALAILASDAELVNALLRHGADIDAPLRQPAEVDSDNDLPVDCARWKHEEALAAQAAGPEREARAYEERNPSDYDSAPTMRARGYTIVTPVPAADPSPELIEKFRKVQEHRVQRAATILEMLENPAPANATDTP